MAVNYTEVCNVGIVLMSTGIRFVVILHFMEHFFGKNGLYSQIVVLDDSLFKRLVQHDGSYHAGNIRTGLVAVDTDWYAAIMRSSLTVLRLIEYCCWLLLAFN